MNDRSIQDDVIRALADARYRASSSWRARSLADADKVEKFARFLARHFYFERIHHFFKYSRTFARAGGHIPESVLGTVKFDALLPTIALGSRQSAEDVAELTAGYVKSCSQIARNVEYLDDLLSYEKTMMVAESGPRLWRTPNGAEGGSAAQQQARPLTDEGSVVLHLEFDIPSVLTQLLSPWDTIPKTPRNPVQLLFARSARGRVAVARSTESISGILALADGSRTLDKLATDTGLDLHIVRETLEGLTELGAVRFSVGS